MSKEEKNYGPQSTAGLVRYFEAEETGIRLTPMMVMATSTGFGLVVLLLKFLV